MKIKIYKSSSLQMKNINILPIYLQYSDITVIFWFKNIKKSKGQKF